MKHLPRSLALASIALAASSVRSQSLFERPVSPEAQSAAAARGVVQQGDASLQQVSLYSVEPPKPREFQAEGLITIIISERSKLDRKQSGESDKEYNGEAALENFLDLLKLLELESQQTTAGRLPKVGISSKTEFEGEGKYLREDRLTDRLTAKILEVKPNGTLVLEARRQWKTDEEEQVAVLSGICRADDVTDTNTVQSNQLYDLRLIVENEGDLDESTKKGLIPRLWETIFNF